MTTENIEGKKDVRDAVKVVADSTKRRAVEVTDEASEINRQKAEDLENAEIAKRALEQESNDRLANIGHEIAQLNFVLNGTTPVEPTTSSPTPVAEPVIVTPTPVVDDEPDQPTPVAEPVIVTPTPVVDDEPDQPTRIQRVIDIRHWSMLQWLLAFAGLIIALVLFSQWPTWASRNIDNGAGELAVNLFWFIGHAGLGFFGGGAIGTKIDERDDS